MLQVEELIPKFIPKPTRDKFKNFEEISLSTARSNYLTFRAVSKTDDNIYTIRILNTQGDLYKKDRNLSVTLYLRELFYLCTRFGRNQLDSTLTQEYREILDFKNFEVGEGDSMAFVMKESAWLPNILQAKTPGFDLEKVIQEIYADVVFINSRFGVANIDIQIDNIFGFLDKVPSEQPSLGDQYQIRYFLTDWASGYLIEPADFLTADMNFSTISISSEISSKSILQEEKPISSKKYASPEEIRSSELRTDTASEIYALGLMGLEITGLQQDIWDNLARNKNEGIYNIVLKEIIHRLAEACEQQSPICDLISMMLQQEPSGRLMSAQNSLLLVTTSPLSTEEILKRNEVRLDHPLYIFKEVKRLLQFCEESVSNEKKLSDQLNQLKKKHISLENNFKSLDQIKRQYEAKNTELESSIDAFKIEKELLSRENTRKQGAITENEQKLSSLNAEKIRLQRLADDLQLRYNRINTKNQKLEEDARSLNSKIATLERNSTDMNLKSKDYEKKMKMLQTNHNELVYENGKLQTKVSKSEQDFKTVDSRYQNLLKEHQLYQTHYLQQKEKNDLLQTEIQTLKGSLKQAEANLKERINSFTRSQRLLKSEIASLKSTIESKSKEVADLSEEKAHLQTDYKQSLSDYDRLLAEYDELQRTVERVLNKLRRNLQHVIKYFPTVLFRIERLTNPLDFFNFCFNQLSHLFHNGDIFGLLLPQDLHPDIRRELTDPNLKNYKEIIMDSTKIRKEEFTILIDFITGVDLKKLKLSGRVNMFGGVKLGNLQENEALMLGKNISWTKMRMLDLSCNKLGDQGAINFSSNKSWTMLEELALDQNQIGDKGSVAIGGNTSWKNLKKLSLTKNSIKNEGAEGIGSNIAWMNLEELWLYDNEIGDEGAIYIACNKSWSKLKTLSISKDKDITKKVQNMILANPILNKTNVVPCKENETQWW